MANGGMALPAFAWSSITPPTPTQSRPICACGDPTAPIDAPNVVDVDSQLRVLADGLQLVSGCKTERCPDPSPADGTNCSFFFVDPQDCFELGYLNGFLRSAGPGDPPDGVGSGSPDGDDSLDVCPYLGEGVHNGNDPVFPLELRGVPVGTVWTDNAFTPALDAEHVEFQWCRWFGGPFSASDPATGATFSWPEFRPRLGERVSVVGDWIVDDHDHTEIHEARIMATLRDDPSMPGFRFHLLTSGFFASGTAQQDQLSLTVPIPPAAIPHDQENQERFLDCSEAVPRFDGGAGLPPILDLTQGCYDRTDVKLLAPVADQIGSTCKISLTHGPAASVSESFCGETGGPTECPCYSASDCASKGISVATMDRCNPLPEGGGLGTSLAYAGDIMATWNDPDDLWLCNCDCQDPSVTGATIPALVQGCAPGRYNPDQPEDVAAACASVCGGGGLMSGSSPDSLIGGCLAADPDQSRAALIARAGCDVAQPQPPNSRVAKAGDFRVDLDHDSSVATVGANDGGTFIPLATPHVSGSFWLNLDPSGRLQIADFSLAADSFTVSVPPIPPLDVSYLSTFIENRFAAALVSGTTFLVDPSEPASAFRLGTRAFVNGVPGGTQVENSAAATVVFDLSRNAFTYDERGVDADGNQVNLQLVGAIANHPPIANPGPDHFAECNSHDFSSVPLDGRASSDPDPGDGVIHYQWFEELDGGLSGVSNQPTATAQASMGPHAYLLDVYDHDLAANSMGVRITVRDTIPPTVSGFVYSGPSCLWPPNHEFAVLRVGRDFTAAVTDLCDPGPKLEVIGAASSQPATGGGSGNSPVDVVVFPDHVCLRAERDGADRADRTYSVGLAGVDASGNRSAPIQVEVAVPHDQSGHACPNDQSIEYVPDGDPLCVPPG